MTPAIRSQDDYIHLNFSPIPCNINYNNRIDVLRATPINGQEIMLPKQYTKLSQKHKKVTESIFICGAPAIGGEKVVMLMKSEDSLSVVVIAVNLCRIFTCTQFVCVYLQTFDMCKNIINLHFSALRISMRIALNLCVYADEMHTTLVSSPDMGYSTVGHSLLFVARGAFIFIIVINIFIKSDWCVRLCLWIGLWSLFSHCMPYLFGQCYLLASCCVMLVVVRLQPYAKSTPKCTTCN